MFGEAVKPMVWVTDKIYLQTKCSQHFHSNLFYYKFKSEFFGISLKKIKWFSPKKNYSHYFKLRPIYHITYVVKLVKVNQFGFSAAENTDITYIL